MLRIDVAADVSDQIVDIREVEEVLVADADCSVNVQKMQNAVFPEELLETVGVIRSVQLFGWRPGDRCTSHGVALPFGC